MRHEQARTMSLAGKVALVTGASRGIGLGIAQGLADRGMAVALNARSPLVLRLAEGMRERGTAAIGVTGDVSEKRNADDMIDRVERELGPLWLLVNNAGCVASAPAADVSETSWDETFAVNVKGVFLCSQAAIRRMIPRRGGRIVNISSIASTIVRTRLIAYSAAKAAVNQFTRCLAVEVAEHGITVNCVLPGLTRTQMTEAFYADRGLDIKAAGDLIPTGRMSDPSDHAKIVAFFADQDAGQITGQVVCMDGGQSLFMPYPDDVVGGSSAPTRSELASPPYPAARSHRKG